MKNNNIKRKEYKDLISKLSIFLLSCIAIVALITMFIMILKEAFPAYKHFGFWHMYFSADFSEKGGWGIWGALTITLFTSVIGVIIATPIAFRTAVYINYRLKYGQKIIRIIISVLAGVPSVIFGVFAINIFSNISKGILDITSSQSIFNATLILTVMVFPTLVSMILNQLRTIPEDMINSTMALGNTKTQAIYKVAKKSIRSGIYIAVITALGRAIGETMALSMVLGNFNGAPFQNLAPGLHSFLSSGFASLGVRIASQFYTDSSDPLIKSALFAAGVALFVVIMVLVIGLTKLSQKKTLRNSNPLKIMKLFPKEDYPMLWIWWTRIIWHCLFLPFRLIRFSLVWLLFKLNQLWSFLVYFLLWPLNYFLLPRKVKGQTLAQYFISTKNYLPNKSSDFMRLFLELVSFIIVVGAVLWVVEDIMVHGLPNWKGHDWQFTYKVYDPIWNDVIIKPGIIANTLSFTLVLIVLTLLISIPFAFGTALYLSEYAINNRPGKVIRFFLDSLGGTPSILFGIFGVLLFRSTFQIANGGFSVIAAALTMVLVVVPTFTRNIEQSLVRVPDTLRQASYALGASKFETIRKVILPQSLPGIISGITLSAGRIMAETAPVYLLIGMLGNIELNVMDQGWTMTTRILFNQLYSTESLSIRMNESYALASASILLISGLIILAEFMDPMCKLISKKIIKPLRNRLAAKRSSSFSAIS